MKEITNFREVPGFTTEDGRRLKPAMLYRAAAPSYESRNQVEQLVKLGIRLICDFRSDREKANDPSDWARELGIRYHSPNAGRTVGDPLEALMKATVSTEQTNELMHQVYRNIPYEQEKSFRELFALMVERNAPALYHCASGKDRTGVFTALLLRLLGAPREVIDADFERSNLAVEAITADFKGQLRLEPIWGSPWEVWSPLMFSRAEWLDTMFATLAERHGSVDGYMQDVMGVGPQEAEALRDLLLE